MSNGPRPTNESTAETHAERVDWYQQHIENYNQEIANDSRSWMTLSWFRGISFLVSVAFLILGLVAYADQPTLWYVLAGLTFAAFLFIAYRHEGIESRRRNHQVWRRLYKWSLARLQRNWDQLKLIDVPVPENFSAFTKDLDLFGRSSLFQLVGGVETPAGIRLFRDWILSVPKSQQIRDRQAAISELEAQAGFRNQFRFLCHLLSAGDGGPDSLTEWAEAPKQFDKAGIIKAVAKVLAVITGILLIGLITQLIPLPLGGPCLLACLAINFLYTAAFAGRIHSTFNMVSTRHGEIGHYYVAFQQIKQGDFKSPMLDGLKQELFSSKSDVLAATNHLGRIAWRANLRRHGMLFIAYIVLQFCFLWDFHTLGNLERWRDKYGQRVRRWFEILGQWEVLAALAQFSTDHVEWKYPQVEDRPKDNVVIACKNLGHPLLDDKTRVSNDVTIGPSGSVLLVTGSNMSGKSTLLRSIGLNVILAHLGAPVCAESMQLSPTRIETSMRIQDSLADGVSFFMAELKRLKQIVDIAREYETDPETTVLFLLDEILQGTNSQERHIAVTRVIRHLIEHRAIGAVSTHDLELGTSGELKDACCPIHFRESFETIDGRKVMTFDYQARQGIATTTNALKLLELVGLDGEN